MTAIKGERPSHLRLAEDVDAVDSAPLFAE